MKSSSLNVRVIFYLIILLLSALSCNALMSVPTATPIPSPIPPTPTSAPLLSQQVTLISQPFEESNQIPPFTIKSQTPQLTGSDDPRVTAFNQRAAELVTKEVDTWRKGFLEISYPTVTNGSSLEVSHTLVSQIGDVWSFKFDFNFYSDGAAHPGMYSITLNYDLGQGRELALGDLFLPNADYLGAVSKYCIAYLSKEMFFEGPFAEGANPTVENYRNWNIAPDGLLITFDQYQVAPYAAGPQQIVVPFSELLGLIDPQGPLGQFAQ
jgi:hypothetical protein